MMDNVACSITVAMRWVYMYVAKQHYSAPSLMLRLYGGSPWSVKEFIYVVG